MRPPETLREEYRRGANVHGVSSSTARSARSSRLRASRRSCRAISCRYRRSLQRTCCTKRPKPLGRDGSRTTRGGVTLRDGRPRRLYDGVVVVSSGTTPGHVRHSSNSSSAFMCSCLSLFDETGERTYVRDCCELGADTPSDEEQRTVPREFLRGVIFVSRTPALRLPSPAAPATTFALVPPVGFAAVAGAAILQARNSPRFDQEYF